MTVDSSNYKNNNDTCSIYLAAVEGGGASFRVAICQLVTTTTSKNDTMIDTKNDSSDDLTIIPIDETTSIHVLHKKSYDSIKDPRQCIKLCCDYLKEKDLQYAALGIASFGPVGLHRNDTKNYGCILDTSPKKNWHNVNILQPLQESCNLGAHQIWMETDVNAPAFAEYMYHNNNNADNPISSCAYVTIGTGVGVGLIVNHEPVHGMMHPEGGHVCIQPLVSNDTEEDDTFLGYSWGTNTPYHGVNTVEGITSSIALAERHMQRKQKRNPERSNNNNNTEMIDRDILKTFNDNDPIWDHCVNAIANLCVTLLLLLSVEKIVLGGGIVSHRKEILLPKIHSRVMDIINGYISITPTVQLVITTSHYHEHAGLVGAIILSYRAYLRSSNTTTTLDNNRKQISTAEPEEMEDDASPSKIMKQIAFSHGLWHGFLVGIVATGLMVKYFWLPHHRTSSSRR